MQKCTREHPRVKHYSFLEWDRDGFIFASSVFRASTPNFLRGLLRVHALCRERGTRSSRIAISGKICAFFATRAKVKKPPRSAVRMPSYCHHAKFRAQACIRSGGVVFHARVRARTLLHMFLVTSTFFCWFFSNYVEDLPLYHDSWNQDECREL